MGHGNTIIWPQYPLVNRRDSGSGLLVDDKTWRDLGFQLLFITLILNTINPECL